MGDAADMMLEGATCQECGEWLEDESQGHPRTCANCASRRNQPFGRQKRCRVFQDEDYQAEAIEKCRQMGLALTIHNRGQHWKFKHSNGQILEWFPSKGRTVFNQNWNKPHVCNRLETVLGLIRRSGWKLTEGGA